MDRNLMNTNYDMRTYCKLGSPYTTGADVYDIGLTLQSCGSNCDNRSLNSSTPDLDTCPDGVSISDRQVPVNIYQEPSNDSYKETLFPVTNSSLLKIQMESILKYNQISHVFLEDVDISSVYNCRPKRTRNSQKRKEKSRDAARCRRGKESEIFNELGEALPMPNGAISNLDKASVIRLCIAYLKTRDLIKRGLQIRSDKTETKFLLQDEPLMLNALHGFIIVMTVSGDVVYTSKNISTYLGLSQIETMGQSIMEFTHPCDHEEIKYFVSQKRNIFRNTFVRLKCTITPKGRSVNLKSASHKVVHMCGRMLSPVLCDDTSEEDSTQDPWVVSLAVPIPHPSNIEIPLDNQIFISRHNLDMKFTYIDDNIKNSCGYESSHLMGRSMYEMNHALDSDLLHGSFKTLFAKGQVETSSYRFLALGGGFVWVITQASLISSAKDAKLQFVVCLNYVLSDVIEPGNIVSEVQILPDINTSPEPSTVYERELGNKDDSDENICSTPASETSTAVAASACRSIPIAATSSLLIERTEDMEEGFLTFSGNDPSAPVFKEEPEDLTHLAPSVGDDFLPLDIPLLFPSDIEDFLKGEPLPLGQGPLSGCSELIYPFIVDSRKHSTDQLASLPTKNVISKIEDNFEDQSNNLVPDLLRRGLSRSPVTRLDTPDPPSPLLSQASTLCSPDIKFHQLEISSDPSEFSSSPTAIEGFSAYNSTMDMFSDIDLKLEDETSFDGGEEYDIRQSYMPAMDDMLCPTQDDLLPAFDLLPILEKNDCVVLDKDEGRNCNLLLRSHSPVQHSKGCVDPNKVLPGHFRVKVKESDKDCKELRNLLQKPTECEPRYLPKRSHSPTLSLHNMKKIRPTDVTNPELVLAPTMQHILVSKAPTKGHFIGSKEDRRYEKRHDSHSVLRNLLVSGYDERAGYTVVVAGLPHADASNLQTDRTLPGGLQNLTTLPVNSEGKVELTKQQLSTLLGSAGLRYVTIDADSLVVSVQPKKKSEYVLINSGMPKLSNLSQMDCEVNAPAPTPSLLQGSELLNALDQTN